MTRVDFYVSPATDDELRLRLACRIAEKAYNLSHHVYIHSDDPHLCQKMDDMLWTFRQGSFIPHGLGSSADDPLAPVVIGHGEPPALRPEVLINLAGDVPDFFSRFERIAEIVAGNEQTRQAARSRFKFYRDRGYPLETHELNS